MLHIAEKRLQLPLLTKKRTTAQIRLTLPIEAGRRTNQDQQCLSEAVWQLVMSVAENGE